MEPLKKGKTIVITIIILSVLISIAGTLSTIAALTSSGLAITNPLVAELIRLLLTVLLFLFLYRGSTWAKDISIVLFALGGITAFLSIFTDMDVLSILMAIIYLGSTALLIGSKNINSFLEAQNQKYSASASPLNR